jgi:tetratricopeptide (TPR) repeat protein
MCGIAEGAPLEARAAAVRRRLATLGETADEDVTILLQMLDLPVDSGDQARLAPEARQARTFTLLGHLLRQAAESHPLVLVIENLHWIDPSSEAWLAFLIQRLASMTVLLLLTQRLNYQPPWGTHAAVTQLALPPLRAEDSAVVLHAVPGSAQLPMDLRQRLIARGAGNPFFVEELAWHAVAHDGVLTPMDVPETVHAVLAARIDQLPPEEKTLLQTAAVIGSEGPVPLVQALVELPEDTLQQGLVHLQAAELLHETRVFPERSFAFKHALTHEVAYGSLLHEQRRTLHARIVEALEVLTTDKDGEHTERLAHHALRGEVWVKALEYCWQAGEKAIARSAYREAAGYFKQALQVLPHLPETRATCEQAIDLRLALRTALFPLGDLESILPCLREAEALAESLADHHRLGQVSRFLSDHFRDMGAYDQAIAAAQRALMLATASGDVVLHTLANRYLGGAYYCMGDYRQAIDCYMQTVVSLKGSQCWQYFGQPNLPAVLSRTLLALCHAELGTFTDGKALGDEGVQMAEAAAHPGSLMLALWGIGVLCLRQGDLPRALGLLERAIGICQDANLPAYFPRLAAALGAAYTDVGRVTDSVPLLLQAMEQSLDKKIAIGQVLCYLALGEAQMRTGGMEEAQALTEHALAHARERQERGHQAYALRLLGAIVARCEPSEAARAEAYYCQALTLAEQLGMRPLQAHCHLGLGTLYSKVGRREKSCAHLSSAIDLYRAMDMTFWLSQTEMRQAQV